MRLISVTIDEFKNLRGLTVNFDETSPYTVVIGENGAGKSNLIEALAIIFRDLDLEVPSALGYKLTYECPRSPCAGSCASRQQAQILAA